MQKANNSAVKSTAKSSVDRLQCIATFLCRLCMLLRPAVLAKTHTNCTVYPHVGIWLTAAAISRRMPTTVME